MRATAPFNYRASYIPFRARSTSSATLSSSIELEIRELDPSEITLAFVAGDAFASSNEDAGALRTPPIPMIDGRPARIYEHEGFLYAEQFPASHLQDILERGTSDDRNPFRVRIVGERTGSVLSYVGGEYVTTRADLEATHPRMRELNDDRGVATAALLAARAEELIVVDDVVCVRTPEPCFAVNVENETVRLVLTTVPTQTVSVFEDMRRDWMWRQDRLWRVDRKDAAMAQAQALAEERGLQVVDETKIEFVRSSSVSFCDDGAAISEVACRTLSALEPSLAETDAAIGLAWYDLRDALNESDGRLAPAVISAMDTIGSIMRQAALDGHRVVGRSVSYSDDGRYGVYASPHRTLEYLGDSLENAVTAALARWDARPTDGFEWIHQGLRLNTSSDTAGIVREVLTLEDSRQLGRDLNVDLSGLAAAAERGEDHLLAVSVRGRPVAAAVCEEGPDASLSIKALFGVAGREPGVVAKRLLAAHMERTSSSLEDEAALADLGIA